MQGYRFQWRQGGQNKPYSSPRKLQPRSQSLCPDCGLLPVALNLPDGSNYRIAFINISLHHLGFCSSGEVLKHAAKLRRLKSKRIWVENPKNAAVQVCGHFYLCTFLQSVFTGVTHTENMYVGPTWCQTNGKTVCVFTVQQQFGSSPLSLCKPASCASFKGVLVAW